MENTVVTIGEDQMSLWKGTFQAYNEVPELLGKGAGVMVMWCKSHGDKVVGESWRASRDSAERWQNISPEPFKSLFPPSGDVNVDDIADKESSSSPRVTDTQPAKEPEATVDATQSIDASESAEELRNHPKTADAIKGMILLDANLDANESPFDTESEIKFIGKEVPKFIYIGSQVNEGDTQGTGLSIFDQVILTTDSNIEFMPSDEIRVNNLESSLAQRVADKIKDSVPILVADAFEESVPELLFETIKNILPQIIKDSIKQALPKFDKRVKKTLNAEIPELLIKPLNNDFNLLNKKEDNQLDKNDVNLRELFDLIRDLVVLIDSASALAKVVPEGEKMSTQENIDSEIIVSAPAQGEQQPINNTLEPTTNEEVKANA
ncbi:hypothetical protein Tco_0525944 [Tanacetum coccineum]